MQFTTTLSLFSAALVAYFALPAQAADYRQLVSFDSQDGTEFCKSWKCACINYEPSNSTLYFRGAYCQPGNYQGENTDTEARGFCTFTPDGTEAVLETEEIAAQLGATVE